MNTGPRWTIFLGLLLLSLLLPVSASAEQPVRKGRLALDAHLDRGVSSGDASAQLGASLEYGLLEHLVLALGYVYLDGLDPLRAHGAEAGVKYYIFGTDLDLLASVFVQPLFTESGLRFAFTGKIAAEWQSPWWFFVGIEGAICFEPASIGYLGGSYLGVRF